MAGISPQDSASHTRFRDEYKLPFRLLSDEERLAFSPEAYGYLLQLQQKGLIDEAMREEILQRTFSYFA